MQEVILGFHIGSKRPYGDCVGTSCGVQLGVKSIFRGGLGFCK